MTRNKKSPQIAAKNVFAYGRLEHSTGEIGVFLLFKKGLDYQRQKF